MGTSLLSSKYISLYISPKLRECLHLQVLFLHIVSHTFLFLQFEQCKNKRVEYVKYSLFRLELVKLNLLRFHANVALESITGEVLLEHVGEGIVDKEYGSEGSDCKPIEIVEQR